MGDKQLYRLAIETAIRISLVFLLLWWCFSIIQPFILLILWGAILAVAVYPLFRRLSALLGNRHKAAATLLTLAGLLLLVVPSVMLTEALVENSATLIERTGQGSLDLPPPTDSVRDWPLIGDKLYRAWSLASLNLTAALTRYSEPITQLITWLVPRMAGAGVVLLQFIASVIIGGIFLNYSDSCSRAMVKITARLVGQHSGEKLVTMAAATVRSVAQGVLGVAVIQSLLASIGLFAAGVPFAAIWSLLVLLLALMQLPTILVLGPLMVYVFSVASTVPAVLFMLWSLFVGVSDTFLKPLLLGRGLDIPMLVILLGAIGGMVMSGFIGLFVGAVVLAVGYRLFALWLEQDQG